VYYVSNSNKKQENIMALSSIMNAAALVVTMGATPASAEATQACSANDRLTSQIELLEYQQNQMDATYNRATEILAEQSILEPIPDDILNMTAEENQAYGEWFDAISEHLPGGVEFMKERLDVIVELRDLCSEQQITSLECSLSYVDSITQDLSGAAESLDGVTKGAEHAIPAPEQ
jgi:hypothetical protein